MAPSRTAHAVLAAPTHVAPPAGGEWLYKADHPRAIDRYIDFFGDSRRAREAGDRCGELFLESLA
jgi:hypothetical protein